MLEKIEIYPYQRVSETAGRRSTFRGRLITAMPGINREQLKIVGGKARRLLQSLFHVEYCVYAGTGFILSRAFVLGELLPFIFAFFTVFGRGQYERTLLMFVLAALGLSTVTGGLDFWSNLGALLVLVMVSNAIKLTREQQWWGLPVLTLSVLLLFKGLLVLFQGASFYEGMTVTFEAMIAGVLTFVFLVVSEALNQRKALQEFVFEDMAAFVILGISVIMGLGDISLGGLSIAAILCRLGILLAAYLWGTGAATITGVMTGILPSISSSVFTQQLAIYAMSGLLAGLFRKLGRLGVVIGFMLGNLALSMFIPETQASILAIWETGVACLIFVLLPDSLKDKIPVTSLGVIHRTREGSSDAYQDMVQDSTRKRIESLACLFDNLSQAFDGEKEKMDKSTQTGYLHYLYDEISQGFCENCSRYELCWGRDCYHTSQEIMEIFAAAEAEREIDYERCPVEFRRRCIHGREMVKTINYLFDNLRINEYWAGKLKESRTFLSRQLSGISQVIKNLSHELDMKNVLDQELRTRLLKEVRGSGLTCTDITPVRNSKGQLCLEVTMKSCADKHTCESQVAPLISSILGENLEVGEKRCSRLAGRGSCHFTLCRAFTYKVRTGVAQVGKEAVCGDSFALATLKEGKAMAVLSDGMGVGCQASNESQAAVNLLENLLQTGFDQETALQTINSVLLLRSRTDRFTTLDVVMIDLHTGESSFVKTGSAPSFIKRKKHVGMVIASSLPVGILEDIEVFSDKRVLYPGDMVVMISDGLLEITREMHDSSWIVETLQHVDENEPQIVAEMILKRALSMCHGQPNDDMTVICLGLEFNLPVQ